MRCAKQTGLENLPFRDFDLNAVWLELSLIAQDLIAWTQALCLDGELGTCEPKALRLVVGDRLRLSQGEDPRLDPDGVGVASIRVLAYVEDLEVIARVFRGDERALGEGAVEKEGRGFFVR